MDKREKTAREMAEEIQKHRFRKDRNYLFVSYSHKDEEEVYPLVLAWLRQGCNIYIDTEFSLQSSDNNWVSLMTEALSDPHCRMAVCFVSTHYGYSDASLLEVLTIRMEKERREAAGDSLAVDYLRLGRLETGGVPEPLREEYEAVFNRKERWQNYISFTDYLRDIGGEEIFSRGLACLFPGAQTPERWRNAINSALSKGWDRFYPTLARLMEEGLSPFYKNYHKVHEDISVQLERFQRAGILPAPPPEPQSQETGPAGQALQEQRLRARYLLGSCCARDAAGQQFTAGIALMAQAAYGGCLPAQVELAFRLLKLRRLSPYNQKVLEHVLALLERLPPGSPDYPAVCWFLWTRRARRKQLHALERLMKTAEQGYVPAMYETAESCGLLEAKLGENWKSIQFRWYCRAANAGPENWTCTEGSDSAALYNTGLISSTPTHAGKVKECCRKARMELALYYAGTASPTKWPDPDTDPEKAAYWEKMAEALKD